MHYLFMTLRHIALSTFLCVVSVMTVNAQSAGEEEVVVIGVTPAQGGRLPPEKIPYNVQTVSGQQLRGAHALDFSDYAARRLGGVSTNEAQNNRLQPDILYRGFTASPLLGLPQGISVYQNGVRINEPLGDTVNWELIPSVAVESIDVIGGTNPVFGLNTLGGALSVQTKTGFSSPGYDMSFENGSFGTRQGEAQVGNNDGLLGYFLGASLFKEDGWRDASGSDLKNLFASTNYRGDDVAIDLNYTRADSELIGNGPIPELLRDREGGERIFTSPDITMNKLDLFDLHTSYDLDDDTQINTVVFHRKNKARSFNGDGSEFEECGMDDPMTPEDETEFLCEEGENDPIKDQNDNSIAEENSDMEERDAIENLNSRDQKSYGGTFQGIFRHALLGRENQLVAGMDYYRGSVDFVSEVRIARLTDERSTATEKLADGSAIYVPGEGAALETATRGYGFYLSDTHSLRDDWHLTLSARYNRTRVEIRDRGGTVGFTGAQPDLDGKHDFNRFNPAVGLTHTRSIAGLSATFYTNYSEGSRAPSPVELACADPTAPCSLPNAFLADPPLKQVVTRTLELGARGDSDPWRWHVGLFASRNRNDIIFQTTGGISSNEGFFANVDGTQRFGVDLSAGSEWRQFSWDVHYSYVRATYRDSFSVLSSNHPTANMTNNGRFTVKSGDRLPGLPEHSFKSVFAYKPVPHARLSVETVAHSDRYLRGDEHNADDPLSGYVLFNFLVDIEASDVVRLFARVDNVFEREYATFGLYGEADEVLDVRDSMGNNIYEDQSRFISPGSPRSYYVGIDFRF